MENGQNNISNEKLENPQEQNQNPFGENGGSGHDSGNFLGNNKKKIFIIIGVAAAVIGLAAGFFLTESASFQGSMLRGGAPGTDAGSGVVQVDHPKDKNDRKVKGRKIQTRNTQTADTTDPSTVQQTQMAESAPAPTETPPLQETPPPPSEVTVFNNSEVPILPAGKTLFDPNTFIATVKEEAGNFEENATTIFFDSGIKAAIGIPIQLPSYSIEDAPNAKDSYLEAIKFSMCDETYTICTSLKEDTTWVYANEKKFQSGNTDQYKFKEYMISNNDLVAQIKNFLKTNGASQKIFLRYSIMDPTNVEIYSNPTELQISELDRSILLAGPIVGTYFDETTFKIKSVEGYSVTENMIHYKKDSSSAMKFSYQLPNHKPGDTEDQYYKTVYLDYCDSAFQNCTAAQEFSTIIFKKYQPGYQNKQTIIQNKALDELVEKNPDKSFFRYRIEDPTGVNIYSNSYQLVVE